MRKKGPSKPGDVSTALVGVVDASCFEAYFGFGGRSFADTEARSGISTGAPVASASTLASVPAQDCADAGPGTSSPRESEVVSKF